MLKTKKRETEKTMFQASWLEKPPSAKTRRLLEHTNESENNERDRTRIPTSESASVTAVDSRVPCSATITDVSTRGMRLVTTQPFPVGITVIVEWSRGFVPCTVRYFRPALEGWVVGVEAEFLPGVVRLMTELKKSAEDRNRSLLLAAKISA
jgi:hypothetical protein